MPAHLKEVTLLESYRFKNRGREGVCLPFPIPSHKSFRCNTYELLASVANKRLTAKAKSFRCNTYTKTGGSLFQAETCSLSDPFVRSLPRYLFISLLLASLLARPDLGPAGEYGGGQAAAGGEFAAHDAPFGLHGGHDVVQHFVNGIFVEDAQAAVSEEIHFQGFQFDAILLRHVLDGDGAEVGETRLRADGGVLGKARGNNVAGKLVGPGFERGQFCGDA